MLRDFLKRFRGQAASPEKADPAKGAELVRAALAEHQLGRFAEAQQLYEQALQADPANIDAQHFTGVIAFEQRRHDVAEELIRKALARNPANAPAHNNLGNVYVASGRADDAAACYRRAIALQPDYADAHLNLGSLLVKQRKLEDAAACYRRGVAAVPTSAALYCALASVLTDCGRLGDAEVAFRRALALKPVYPDARSGLGTALLASGRPAEAEQSFREALAQKPDFARARFGCALAMLMTGNYGEGLALYEARFEDAEAALRARLGELERVTRWQGAGSSGGRLLVWADQGLGDMLMCMRYLPRLKERGFARVIVECLPPLERIVRAVPGVDHVVPQGRPLPFADFDCHCPMGSLPLAFGTRIDSIPGSTPYLHVPEVMRAEWRERLASLGRFRVGLAWAGRPDYPKDALRSVPLERLRRLFQIPGIDFFSLQKGEAGAQAAKAGLPIHDYMDRCRDLLDTSALIEQLDLVISVDTAVVHLAGALGRQTWLLNRFESEWRWMLGREDSAWYPKLRIFRQREPGAWDDVIIRIADALRRLT